MTASHWLVVTLIALGILVRVVGYPLDRSLWNDEAVVGSQVLGSAWGTLLTDGSYDRTAPAGWLALVKGASGFGGGETLLRFPSLVASVVTLVLMAVFARGVVGPGYGTLALALTALSPATVRYATELKPYSTDIAVTLVLFLLALRVLRSVGRLPVGSLAALTIAGAIAVWVSHPSLFVLAAVGVTLFATGAAARDASRVGWVAGMIAVWAGSFLAAYLTTSAGMAHDPALARYWQHQFTPLPVTALGELRWFTRVPMEVATFFFGRWVALLAIALGVVGAVSLWRRQPSVAAITTLSIAGLLIGSALRHYPIWGRLVLFAFPVIVILVVTGVRAVATWRPVARLPLAPTLAVVLIAPSVFSAARAVQSPSYDQHLRPLLVHLARESRPGDSVYVFHGARRSFDFYHQHQLRDLIGHITPVYGSSVLDTPAAFDAEVARWSRSERMWMVFVHFTLGNRENERAELRERASARGTEVDHREEAGASLHLFRFTPL